MAEPKSMPPSLYRESRFWRFVLDTRELKGEMHEPRFRQFAECLRNYVASGLVLKVGTSLFVTSPELSTRVPAFVLVGVGAVAGLLSEAQLFGLSVLAFHWYIGFNHDEYYPQTLSAHVRSGTRMITLITLPALLLWAMAKFVMSAAWPV